MTSTSEIEDFLNQTDEELASLFSIYGDEFRCVDDGGRNFAVPISAEHDVSLSINLPLNYPATVPPVYVLVAPSIRGEIRRQIQDDLCRHVRERFSQQCCLYELIEKARDLVREIPVLDKPKTVPTSPDHSNTETKHVIPKTELEHEDVPEILHGEPFVERRSTFQAHLAVVDNVKQVQAVLCQLKQNRKIAEATHNIMAYRILGPGDTVVSDCDDDGESQAGSRLLHLLHIVKAAGVVVVVSRWFGGILLGPERFKHITNAARDILTAHKHLLPEPGI